MLWIRTVYSTQEKYWGSAAELDVHVARAPLLPGKILNKEGKNASL